MFLSSLQIRYGRVCQGLTNRMMIQFMTQPSDDGMD
jgi:hypothetical protein